MGIYRRLKEAEHQVWGFFLLKSYSFLIHGGNFRQARCLCDQMLALKRSPGLLVALW